jgi:broad specificity phosphatase PhoE
MGILLLVRHGQASFGTDDYDVLSETGWEQSRLLGRWLREHGVVPDAVIRGGLRRHRETAEAIGWPDAAIDEGWDEFDHLNVVTTAGLPATQLDRREFQRAFEAATARWAAGGHDDEYAESWPGFRARVRSAFHAAAAQAGPGRTVAVVSSGGTIASVCADLVDPAGEDAAHARMWDRFNTVLANSSFTRVVIGSTGTRLLAFNEHPHLRRDEVTYR